MTGEQDCSDAAATPALLLWSRLIQGAASVVIVLSLTLLLSPNLGEAIFNLVYFHQFSMPVEVPSLAHGYIWFANGVIGAVTDFAVGLPGEKASGWPPPSTQTVFSRCG